MTNVGTVVLIGIIYALDVCYIALTSSPMIPLELQPLLVYHNDRTDRVCIMNVRLVCVFASSSCIGAEPAAYVEENVES